MLVSTKRMAGMEFIAAEVVRGIEAEATGAELGAEFLLFALQALELRLSVFIARQSDEKIPEHGGDGCGLFSRFDAGQAVKLVVHADGDVFHGDVMVLQFHSWNNGFFMQALD
jgi:hypothetical protein